MLDPYKEIASMNQTDTSGNRHPGHHSIRLNNADYSQSGLYFVTICSHQQKCIFGRILNFSPSLSDLGNVVLESWESIPVHFPWVGLLEFVVMSNHIHGILQTERQFGRSSCVPQRRKDAVPFVAPGSLGAIVRSFKSIVTKRAHIALKFRGEVWQRNYYERILRPGQELANARAYIRENPGKWESDQENPKGRQHGDSY